MPTKIQIRSNQTLQFPQTYVAEHVRFEFRIADGCWLHILEAHVGPPKSVGHWQRFPLALSTHFPLLTQAGEQVAETKNRFDHTDER